MSTKTTTDNKSDSSSALQYDPGSKGLYSSLTGSGANILGGYMNNPFSNPTFQMGLGQSQAGATASGNQAMQMLGNNQKISGLSGNAGQGWLAQQKSKTGRSNLSMMAGANTSNVMQALQRQMQATGMGMAFQPLMTGEKGNSNSNTTQQTGGTGTWLPQLLGAAAGMGMGALTGGASTALGGLMGGMGGSSVPGGGSIQSMAPSGASGLFGTVPGSSGPPMGGLQPWMFGGG